MTKLEEELSHLEYVEVDSTRGIWEKEIFGILIFFIIEQEKIVEFNLSNYDEAKLNDLPYALEKLTYDLYKLEEFIDD